ncbi:MAG: isochorismatase family protein [Sedimentisphaerales bacterium]|nr:isochorismatase family protein [Sedimentisphaerales bacterium]
MPHKNLLNADDCLLLVADIQDAFLPHILNIERVIKRSQVAVQAAQVLELPIIVTEQYPQGLGRTVAPLQKTLAQIPYHEKLTFNCLSEPAIKQAILAANCHQVLIVGIEAHICVSQTAHALLAQGFTCHVAADAVSSRKQIDYDIALARMRHAGITITTTEAAVMEMTQSSRHPNFKAISQIIK